jgi:hypothetical protein
VTEVAPGGRALRLRRAIGIAIVVASPLMLIGLVYGLVPGREPRFDKPNFLEAVFASRLTVTVARLAIVFAAAYVVISVTALISRGQWLSRVGPVQVSESVRAVTEQRDRLALQLEEARRTIESLSQQMEALAERAEATQATSSSPRRRRQAEPAPRR